MNHVKNAAIQQCRKLIRKVSKATHQLTSPQEGWLSIVRQALGMSGAQLARRLGVTRAYISKAEKAELSGSISIKTMQKIAESMECKVVYCIVPKSSIDDVLQTQANKKAKSIVKKSSVQMALEDQALSKEILQKEIKKLQKELLENPGQKFWDDEA